jgi:hypothetical protein
MRQVVHVLEPWGEPNGALALRRGARFLHQGLGRSEGTAGANDPYV